MNIRQEEFNKYCKRLGENLEGQNQISFSVGWFACQAVILEILNKHTQPIFDTELRKEDWEKVINLEAIKEIEKL
jgi:hypothetical protein